jgi:hypothetical protein
LNILSNQHRAPAIAGLLLTVFLVSATCVPSAPRSSTGAYPVDPYISRQNQIDALPQPQNSVYVQPWRGYLETVPATRFLAGIGIDYDLDDLPDGANDDAAIKALAEAGFRSLRVEIGWADLDPTETALRDDARVRFKAILSACHEYGVTPLVLLNANSGAPEPTPDAVFVTVSSAAPANTSSVHLSSVDSFSPGHSGLTLPHHPMAGFLFTSVDPVARTVTLSKPLPNALHVGTRVRVDTLRHLPLYPVGTPQFQDTASAWVHYADLVAQAVEDAGNASYDVEIWNELTFGSEFLDINKYYERPVVAAAPDSFNSGGSAWELANRTTAMLHSRHPGARVIWGFSNTHFYATDPSQLPPGTDGQSYHPYHTEPLAVPAQFPGRAQASLFNAPGARIGDRSGSGYLPRGLTIALPEGGLALGLSVEQLPRDVLAPWVRNAERPPGTASFSRYFTEHGVEPSAGGITDPTSAREYKAKSLLRMLTFWLNKGVTREDVFDAWSSSDLEWGLLPSSPNPSTYRSTSTGATVGASPALSALRNLRLRFAGAQSLDAPRQLGFEVTATGPQYQVFPGDSRHPPLWYRDMFTALPFQVNDHRFVVATYVMSYDLARQGLPHMKFDLAVDNVNGARVRLSYYDPLTDQTLPVRVLSRGRSSIKLAVDTLDYPRLLTIDDGQ